MNQIRIPLICRYCYDETVPFLNRKPVCCAHCHRADWINMDWTHVTWIRTGDYLGLYLNGQAICTGIVDEFGVWDRALSQDEIELLANFAITGISK